MCQLTYSNLKSPYLNALAVYFLTTKGSEKHDDGCGIMCSNNAIWKSEHAANKIMNYGQILYADIKDEVAVPAHIRMATWGIEVTKENAHPFMGEKFILMHNGTLLPRNGEEPKDKKKDSDSLRFLLELDAAAKEKKAESFEVVFNAAMDKFAGKFAFIIRHKDTNTNYIVRGRTAELWISHLTIGKKKAGYIVNTSKDTMSAAFKDFVNVAALIDGLDYTFSEPVLLEAETIFVAGKDNIRTVGKTKEITPIKPVVEVKTFAADNTRTSIVPTRSKDVKPIGDLAEIVRSGERLHRYLNDHFLDIIDLQMIVQVLSGTSLLEINKDDIEMLIEFLIPKITASGKTLKKIGQLLDGAKFPHQVYDRYELEYPWPVNNPNKVIDALEHSINTVPAG